MRLFSFLADYLQILLDNHRMAGGVPETGVKLRYILYWMIMARFFKFFIIQADCHSVVCLVLS